MSGFNWLEELPEAISAALVNQSKLLTFCSNVTLFSQGDTISQVIQIVSGEVRKCILTEDGQEVLIYIYKPGDLIGDSSLSDETPFPVTMMTRGVVTARVWQYRDFNQLRLAFPEVQDAVYRQTSKRLDGMLRLVEELLTQPVTARVASRLQALSALKEEPGEAVQLPLSQADIALMVGSSRQSVNRVIHELRKRQIISTHYGKIVIHDFSALDQYIKDHRRKPLV